MSDWHYIPFYASCYFFIFQFPYVIESSVLLSYFLWQKSLVWFLKQSLNEVFAIPKYFLSGLPGAGITALHTMFVVKHLLSSGHSAQFLQLHSCLLEVSWIILQIVGSSDWAHSSAATITQLYRIFIKDFWHFIMFRKVAVD